MPLQIDGFLRHILDEAEFITYNSEDLEIETYLADPILQRAFVRSI